MRRICYVQTPQKIDTARRSRHYSRYLGIVLDVSIDANNRIQCIYSYVLFILLFPALFRVAYYAFFNSHFSCLLLIYHPVNQLITRNLFIEVRIAKADSLY